MILADQIQIVLVLCDHEVVVMEIVDELIQNEMKPELFAVDQHHACVKEIVAGYAHNLLDIITELTALHHSLLMAGTEVSVTDLGEIQPADVSADDRIAVQIQGLGILREHFRDKETIVGRLGIIVPERKLVGNGLKILGHIYEPDLDILAGKPEYRVLHLFGDLRVKDMDDILIFF
jgi:hypothetical protein